MMTTTTTTTRRPRPDHQRDHKKQTMHCATVETVSREMFPLPRRDTCGHADREPYIVCTTLSEESVENQQLVLLSEVLSVWVVTNSRLNLGLGFGRSTHRA